MNNPILKTVIFALAILTIAVANPSLTIAKSSNRLPSVDVDERFIEVDDLGAEYHSSSSTIVVTAKIKNVSRSILRGYTTIYLLSPSGEEVYSFEVEVNEGDGFTHGTTILFEASTHVPDIDKVGSISVGFTRK